MSKYEIIFIARQDLQLKALETIVNELNDVLDKSSSQFLKVEYCGLRPLAYPIKKNRKGHYILYAASVNNEGLKHIHHFMYYNESIIRFLINKIDKYDHQPSLLLLQSKSYIDTNAKSIGLFATQLKKMDDFENSEADAGA